jgi:hypothetical protein
MMDQLVALVEAVRLARIELECHRDPLCRATDAWTIDRLSSLLESEDVSRAMEALVPGERSPSIVPESATENLQVPYPWRVR